MVAWYVSVHTTIGTEPNRAGTALGGEPAWHGSDRLWRSSVPFTLSKQTVPNRASTVFWSSVNRLLVYQALGSYKRNQLVQQLCSDYSCATKFSQRTHPPRPVCTTCITMPNAFILLGGSLLAVLQQAKHWRDQRPARPIPCPTRTLHKRRSWHMVAPGRWYGLSPGPL